MKKSLKSLKTPLRYPGGKSRACIKMEKYLPNLATYEQYREPFIGGGSFAIHVTKLYSNLPIWVNDLYKPLATFWQQLQESGDVMSERLLELKEEYNTPDKAKELFETAKKELNESDQSELSRACNFYIINKCSFSGLTESSSFSPQASTSNFTVRGIEKLPEYKELISNWVITNYSYEEVLKDGMDSFIYLDPPYDIKDNLYGKKGGMHKTFDHDKFAEDCEACQSHQLVSYNNSQLVKDRFAGWDAAEYELTYTMRSTGDYMGDQSTRKELLLLNYERSSLMEFFK